LGRTAGGELPGENCRSPLTPHALFSHSLFPLFIFLGKLVFVLGVSTFCHEVAKRGFLGVSTFCHGTDKKTMSFYLLSLKNEVFKTERRKGAFWGLAPFALMTRRCH